MKKILLDLENIYSFRTVAAWKVGLWYNTTQVSFLNGTSKTAGAFKPNRMTSSRNYKT